jgi:hypothetical protein
VLKSFSLKKLLTGILLLKSGELVVPDGEEWQLKLNNNVAESNISISRVDSMIDFMRVVREKYITPYIQTGLI